MNDKEKSLKSIQNLKKCAKKQSVLKLLWDEIGPEALTICIIVLAFVINWIWVVPCVDKTLLTATMLKKFGVTTLCILAESIVILLIVALGLGIYSCAISIINSLRFIYRITKLPLTKEELKICGIENVLDYDKFLKDICLYDAMALWNPTYPYSIRKQIANSVLELFTEEEIKEYLILIEKLKENDVFPSCYIKYWIKDYADYDLC